jgi:hypothetical protein
LHIKDPKFLGKKRFIPVPKIVLCPPRQHASSGIAISILKEIWVHKISAIITYLHLIQDCPGYPEFFEICVLIVVHKGNIFLDLSINILAGVIYIPDMRLTVRIVAWYLLRLKAHEPPKIQGKSTRHASVQASKIAHEKTFRVEIHQYGASFVVFSG